MSRMLACLALLFLAACSSGPDKSATVSPQPLNMPYVWAPYYGGAAQAPTVSCPPTAPIVSAAPLEAPHFHQRVCDAIGCREVSW